MLDDYSSRDASLFAFLARASIGQDARASRLVKQSVVGVAARVEINPGKSRRVRVARKLFIGIECVRLTPKVTKRDAVFLRAVETPGL